jgi:TPR repeat protein
VACSCEFVNVLPCGHAALNADSLPVGCSYGLALRSGWGVVKDERQAFDFLRRAADSASLGTQTEAGTAVVGSEVVVAILEVGQCFLHGWGCKKVRSKLPSRSSYTVN